MRRWLAGGAVFLLFILVLTSGSSYFALDAAKQGATSDDDRKMAVALVNEDEGGQFNGKKYTFGNEFVKSIEKDNSQDWYVVSRGVAENGLNDNTYNMMIVIPSDFTKRALSIDSKNPQNIVLDYKVNASDSSALKAKAEKTAGSILENFNRRIIDVYFASVLGNLHDAQDNVSALVNEEKQHTSDYMTHVNAPIAGYTGQFATVQDRSQLSKEAFKGFQDLLESNSSVLADGKKEGDSLQNDYLDYVKMKSMTDSLAKIFTDRLLSLNDALTSEAVKQQLDSLHLGNEAVRAQFSNKTGENANIRFESDTIRQYLANTANALRAQQNDLETTLQSDLQQSISGQLQKNFNAGDQKVPLNRFFEGPDKAIRAAIEREIEKLPALKLEEIENAGLDESVSSGLKNVISVTNQYDEEFGYTPLAKNETLPIVEQVEDIKKNLEENGLVLSDEVADLPEMKKDGQIFTLQIPDAFTLEKLTLALPGGEEKTYGADDVKDNGVTLPKTAQGPFSVKAKVILKKDREDVKLFEPVAWSWKIKQEDATDSKGKTGDDESGQKANGKKEKNSKTGDARTKVAHASKGETTVSRTPKSTGGNANSGAGDKGDSGSKGSRSSDGGSPANSGTETGNKAGNTDNGTGTGNEAGNTPGNGSGTSTTNDNPGNGTANDNPGNGSGTGNGAGNTDNSTGTGTGTDPQNPGNGDAGNGGTGDTSGNAGGTQQPEPVTIVNNTISHQAMTMLTDDPENKLMKSLNETIREYQKTAMLYELYFGKNADDLAGAGSLKDAATEDSLYYLFNKQNIADVLAAYIAGQISEDVRAQTAALKNKTDGWLKLVEETQSHADQMASQIQAAMAQAENMNTAIAATLQQLDDWRQTSLNLQKDNGQMAESMGKEGTMAVSLGDRLTTLLATSESLKEVSEHNLHAADTVFTTFDEIDKQAGDIKTSGKTLVKRANSLSDNLLNKLSDDEKFAKNFAGVLANSRIGNRPNEDLLNFLSNPVQTKNSGTIVAKDSFVPYYLVLIFFISALFTAYVLSTIEKRRASGSSFEEEKPLYAANMPAAFLTAGTGIAEGLLIGAISAAYLHIAEDKYLPWIGLSVAISFSMVAVAAYLLWQLKMAGMFILLMVLCLYLFLTDTLGIHFDPSSAAAMWQRVSPLQYIQDLLAGFDSHNVDSVRYLIVLVSAGLLAEIGQLFVLNRFTKAGEAEEDDVHQAL
ncbi:type VII secretion protein EsaA [Weizmannia sp. CD-2023]|uniref:type VII secretion protein EsaA n=2 Tax=Bacillati TaxID=1783272 RepID=UPI001F2EE586|nr:MULTISPECIES: type VII secretion protein EsaA [Heyndrickxia]MED4322105.1 type VII secretion protein EsaA [Weizmannia sp. CD-2023]